MTSPAPSGKIARLETNMGTIRIDLASDMPITAGNFEKLVREGFYNGVIFHRIISTFMIQGGGFTPDMAKVLPMKRQALHAFSMDFTKVFNNPSMNFKAPLHKDFRDFMISRQISLPEEFDI